MTRIAMQYTRILEHHYSCLLAVFLFLKGYAPIPVPGASQQQQQPAPVAMETSAAVTVATSAAKQNEKVI